MIARALLITVLGAVALSVVDGRVAPKSRVTYVLALLGDSFTDTGNTLRAGGLPDPTLYYKGRFTNGPNWVDFLNATLSKKYSVKVFNYAWGGSSACDDNSTAAAYPYIKHLEAQTAEFAADVKSGKIPSGKNVRILPIQLSGANDLMTTLGAIATGASPSQDQIAALVSDIVRCRVRSAQMAAALPGVKDVVVLPMLPIFTAPATPAAFKPMLKHLLDGIDAQAAQAVAAAQAPLEAAGKRLHHLGDNSWIARGTEQVKPPFKNMTAPCLHNPGGSLVITPGLKPCADPRNHCFYDDTHPSSRYYQWFATKGVLPRLQQLRLLPKDV